MLRLFAALLLSFAVACSAPQSATIVTGDGPGGPFQLIDQNGRAVDESLLDGKWTAVFFGFTHCPDICPATLLALGAAEAELGRRADDLQIVFVSVDPARDTPANLKAYVEDDAFPKGTIGLTGTQPQIDAMLKTYFASAAREGDEADYAMNHTTAVYLMNPDGEFVRPLAYGMTPAEMAGQIRDAMRRG